jgi:gas vesicle protein
MGKNRSGLLLGMIAGTALGILFAPKKGKTLRESIKKERIQGGYGLGAVKDGFIDMGKEVVSTAQEAYESDPVQEQLGKARVAAEEMAEEGKKRATKVAKKAGRKAKTATKRTATKAKRKARKTAKTTAKRASTKARKFTKKKLKK